MKQDLTKMELHFKDRVIVDSNFTTIDNLSNDNYFVIVDNIQISGKASRKSITGELYAAFVVEDKRIVRLHDAQYVTGLFKGSGNEKVLPVDKVTAIRINREYKEYFKNL